jgi:hypothetical protein
VAMARPIPLKLFSQTPFLFRMMIKVILIPAQLLV